MTFCRLLSARVFSDMKKVADERYKIIAVEDMDRVKMWNMTNFRLHCTVHQYRWTSSNSRGCVWELISLELPNNTYKVTSMFHKKNINVNKAKYILWNTNSLSLMIRNFSHLYFLLISSYVINRPSVLGAVQQTPMFFHSLI